MSNARQDRFSTLQLTRRAALQMGAIGSTMLLSSHRQSAEAATAAIIEKVTIGVGDEPPLFDAHRAYGGISSYFFTNVYEGLLATALDQHPVPALATKWDISPDGLTYAFTLREGVKFHTGELLTAEDVVFSFRRFRDPKVRTHQSNINHLQTCEAIGDHAVRIKLSRRDPTLLAMFANVNYFRILSKRYYDKVGDEGFEKAPVGTGPYKFVRRSIKQFWDLERFEDYWDEKPVIKRATFRVIPEAVTLAAALKTGEIDVVQSYPPTFVDELSKTRGFRVVKNRTVNTIDLRINAIRETDPVTGAPNPFADRRVRLAMNYAIDKDAIIKNLLKGMGEKVAVLFPEDIGYDPELKPYPYDPKKAKELLAEAGYSKGINANYYGLVGQRMPMSKEVGEAVAQYLTAAGIRTKVINEEYGMWLKRSNSRDSTADVSLQLYPFGYGMTWVGGAFHSAFGLKTNAYSGGPFSWWESKEYDAVVDEIWSAGDEATVEELCRKAARILHEGAGTVALYRVLIAYAMKDSLTFSPTVNSTAVELKNLRPA